jgi:hypothetical protein
MYLISNLLLTKETKTYISSTKSDTGNRLSDNTNFSHPIPNDTTQISSVLHISIKLLAMALAYHITLNPKKLNIAILHRIDAPLHLVPPTLHIEEVRLGDILRYVRRFHERHRNEEQEADEQSAEEALEADCNDRCNFVSFYNVLFHHDLLCSAA